MSEVAGRPLDLRERLFRFLGISSDAELADALRSDEAAKRALSRRGFLSAATALVAGTVIAPARTLVSVPVRITVEASLVPATDGEIAKYGWAVNPMMGIVAGGGCAYHLLMGSSPAK
jgi:hypothetical protein